ncbi:hypothetical protein QBC38DRAFT_503388 [Podospora fimiseda]|uniref:Ricin B lectin domain-containing protein n=1 Tax=Podospora fimiseda TaxID=252190 RepID=A0AAN7BH11_9PEZI|nr:hypothetical protein QBC38DRAFT_503388 [Podospora fimiseda]
MLAPNHHMQVQFPTQGSYRIHNRWKTDHVLGIQVKNNVNHLGAQQSKPTDESQIWLIEAVSDGTSFRIRNALSRLVWTADAKSGCTRVILNQESPDSNPSQGWSFRSISNTGEGRAYYRITSNSKPAYSEPTDWSLTLWEIGPDDDLLAFSSLWKDVNWQHWTFEPVVNHGSYRISHLASGRYLQLNDQTGSTVVATTQILSTDVSWGQLWFVEPVGVNGTTFVIRSAGNKRVLALGNTSTGQANVELVDYNGGIKQQWRFVDGDPSRLNETCFNIVNVSSETLVGVKEQGSLGTLEAQTARARGDRMQIWQLHQYRDELSDERDGSGVCWDWCGTFGNGLFKGFKPLRI